MPIFHTYNNNDLEHCLCDKHNLTYTYVFLQFDKYLKVCNGYIYNIYTKHLSLQYINKMLIRY